jgi:hypothetical protein
LYRRDFKILDVYHRVAIRCNYGGQDLKGFHLAVLTNMGLQAAVHEVPLRLWLAAIQAEALKNPKLNPESEMGAAMLKRLNRGLEDLNAVAEFLAK